MAANWCSKSLQQVTAQIAETYWLGLGRPVIRASIFLHFFLKTSDSSRFRIICFDGKLICCWEGPVKSAKILLKNIFHSLTLASKSFVSSHFGNIQFHDHGCKARINALEPEVESCNHKIWFLQFLQHLDWKNCFSFPNICQTISIYVIFSNEVYWQIS